MPLRESYMCGTISRSGMTLGTPLSLVQSPLQSYELSRSFEVLLMFSLDVILISGVLMEQRLSAFAEFVGQSK